VPIENLDGYPGLDNYIRYMVQSEKSNDIFLRAFDKMPVDYYKMKATDKRILTLRSCSQGQQEPFRNPRIGNLIKDREVVTKAKGVALTEE